jgi:acyl-ACP thioesterase
MLQQSFSTDAPIFSLPYFKYLFDSIETTAIMDGTNVVASFDEMMANGLQWVMADFNLQLLDKSLFTQKCSIVTFPVAANVLYANRAHNIYNESGILMAQSCTRWVTMDINTRGLGRIPNYLIQRVYQKELDYLPYQKMKLKKDFDVTRMFNYIVGEADVDQNNHTNNTVYMKLCIESASIMGQDLSTISNFAIQFKKESYINDFLIVNASLQKTDRDRILVRIDDGTGNAEVGLSEIRFM